MYIHMLFLKYLLPPSDLTKEMQVEGINAYERGKTETMGKDGPGLLSSRKRTPLSATLAVKGSASPCWKQPTAALAPEIAFQSHHQGQ